MKLLRSKAGSHCYPKLAGNEPFPKNNIHEVGSPRSKARLRTLHSYGVGDKIAVDKISKNELARKSVKWNEKP